MTNDTIKIMCEHSAVVAPASLKDHPRNPNKHPQQQIDALATNISTFGWRHPVVVSKRSGLIVAGHCRKQAAIKLGCMVPVDYQDFENDQDELAVLLADNLLPELAYLDTDLLRIDKELLELAGLDLTSIGFKEEFIPDVPEDEWADSDAPEYKQDELKPFRSIIIYFKNREYLNQFAEVTSLKITDKTKYSWYPKIELDKVADIEYKSKK